MRALVLAIALSAPLAAPATACVHIPPLAAAMDTELQRAELSQADRARVAELRAQIRELVALGKKTEARSAEEQAMLILGYRKVWLKCGPGIFAWMKLGPGEPRH